MATMSTDVATSITEAITNSTSLKADPGMNVWGLVSVIVFYIMILVIGLYASWKNKSLSSEDSEDVFLAGRSIGLFVGMFTMTATWVGGGYINGTAEKVYGKGLVWAQAPIGYSISLILGGLLFAKKMRKAGYVTMLDPLDKHYGEVMAALLYLPALLGELFWSGAILSALGASLAVILNMGHDTAIIISAGVAIFYTVVGGLYSVAFTDVIQLICIFIGLWLGVGFALVHPAVRPIGETMFENAPWSVESFGNVTWLGELPEGYAMGLYVDKFLLLIFGGIPWQVYFQRVLSSKDEQTAQVLSFVAGFGCIFMAIPAVIVGAIGRSADWAATDYPGTIPIPEKEHALILPLVLQYSTPTVVSVIGLGAVSAAVMSSADSSILSAASMFSRNVYRPIRNACSRQSKTSERELLWVMRAGVVVVGIFATYVAITIDSIYGLWYLCSDLIYAILFPQLLTVIYMERANTYGSVAAYIAGLFFRISGGEPLIGMKPFIYYPWWEEYHGEIIQNFPFKTMSMMISLLFLVTCSLLSHHLFTTGKLSAKYDIFHCFDKVDTVDKTGLSNGVRSADEKTDVELKLLESNGTTKQSNGHSKQSNGVMV